MFDAPNRGTGSFCDILAIYYSLCGKNIDLFNYDYVDNNPLY